VSVEPPVTERCASEQYVGHDKRLTSEVGDDKAG
jgi:hypothetical protein